MAKLNLTLACWDYDRTRPLMDRVQPEGIELNYLPMAVEETFFRMLRHREFDVAELSLSSYCVSLSRPEQPFIAIPVFPSRYFRHSCIFVSAKSKIREPKDLIGKRIGTPEYQMTAPVWIRGVLADDYGVPVDSVTYVTGGEETPGRDEKLKLDLPARIKIERAPGGKSTRCTPRARRRASPTAAATRAACSRTSSRSSAPISSAPASSRSCT